MRKAATIVAGPAVTHAVAYGADIPDSVPAGSVACCRAGLAHLRSRER